MLGRSIKSEQSINFYYFDPCDRASIFLEQAVYSKVFDQLKSNHRPMNALHANLLAMLKQLAPLSSADKELIVSSFTHRSLAKGEFFLREGNRCKQVGFLNQGLVRYFVYKNDEESTFEFTKEGDFIADYSSFNRQTISLQNIEAIEDCELLVIDHAKLQHLFQHTTHGNQLGRLIIEHRFDIMVNQLLAVYMQNSEQRYRKFISEYADLSQRIPQYLIASYVGVKPPSLSRIRRRLSQ